MNHADRFMEGDPSLVTAYGLHFVRPAEALRTYALEGRQEDDGSG